MDAGGVGVRGGGYLAALLADTMIANSERSIGGILHHRLLKISTSDVEGTAKRLPPFVDEGFDFVGEIRHVCDMNTIVHDLRHRDPTSEEK